MFHYKKFIQNLAANGTLYNPSAAGIPLLKRSGTPQRTCSAGDHVQPAIYLTD